MENENIDAANSVTMYLGAMGFRAALIPFASIEQITKIYNAYVESENAPFSIKDWFLSKQPPDIPFKPLSFLVIAFQSPAGEISIKYKGKEVLLPIPPTYLDDPIKHRLNEILKSATDGYQLAEAKAISLKLLAVLSSLGKYGRNALCYLDGYGSFCNFDAYYTDIPCENDAHEPMLMELCEACGLCIENCPNDALGGSLIIDMSRCLTVWNEHNGPLPDWLSPGVHHAAVGCMRCQEICPANKALLRNKKEPLELSEAETETLLSSPSAELPPELVKKLLDYGLWEMFVNLAGRNIKLALLARQKRGNDV